MRGHATKLTIERDDVAGLERPVDTGPDTTGTSALIWCDDADVEQRLREVCRTIPTMSLVTAPDGVIALKLQSADDIALVLKSRLNSDERGPIKTLIFDGETPSLQAFSAIRSADALILDCEDGMVQDLIAERRYRSLMQPIVHADRRDVHGYEFLFRGVDHKGDQLPPLELFESAQREGCVNVLDRTAAICAAETCARLGLDTRIFVNLLPSTLMQGREILEPLERTVLDTGLSPEQIVVELVELERTDDVEMLVALVREMQRRGFKIALDDFGAGFNNLTTLIDIAPDYLKLDKGLTRDIDHDSRAWNLVANVLDAARHTGILTIAEGIETQAAAEKLEDLGADFLQGFYFGMPLDRPEAKNLRSRA